MKRNGNLFPRFIYKPIPTWDANAVASSVNINCELQWEQEESWRMERGLSKMTGEAGPSGHLGPNTGVTTISSNTHVQEDTWPDSNRKDGDLLTGYF